MQPRSLFRLFAQLIVFGAMLCPLTVLAMGKPKPKPPLYTSPNPLRYVIIRPIQNLNAFATPNQVVTSANQIQTAFTAILDGVTTSAGLSVIHGNDIGNLGPCGQHLELWPAVTDFTLNDTSVNVAFGFNSVGSINVGQPQVNASDRVTFGSVKMEFTLYECDNSDDGTCTSLVASDADQTVLGNNFSFNVVWSQFSVPGSILTQSDLSNAVQSIMAHGLKKLMNNPQMATVPWSTTILSANPDGTYTIFAGENTNLKLKQYFTISTRLNSSSQCGVAQALACGYTSEVNNQTSVLTIYRTLSQGQGVPILAGDIVEVGSSSCAPPTARKWRP